MCVCVCVCVCDVLCVLCIGCVVCVVCCVKGVLCVARVKGVLCVVCVVCCVPAADSDTTSDHGSDLTLLAASPPSHPSEDVAEPCSSDRPSSSYLLLKRDGLVSSNDKDPCDSIRCDAIRAHHAM